jgi:hypothetical protein
MQGFIFALQSSPVTTATTPGSFNASVASMDRIFACGRGLRRIAACSRPWSFRSAMYPPRPTSRRGSSTRLRSEPITLYFVLCAVLLSTAIAHGLRVLSSSVVAPQAPAAPQRSFALADWTALMMFW